MPRRNDRVKESFGIWKCLTQDIVAEDLSRGKTIYTPDQPSQDLFVVTHGQVGLHLLAPEKRTLMLHVVEPGHLFGHITMTGEGLYDSFAETLTAVRFYRIQRADMLTMMSQDGTLALKLLEELGEYRLRVSHQIDEVAFKSVPARLASLLLDMAQNRDGEHVEQFPRRSHRQLAEMINAYRETVTKVINQFRAARLLEIDRSTITLVNRSGLEELAQGW